MGIDARMLLRVRGNPTDDELKLWGYSLCSTIGAEHFFIDPKDGRGAIERADADSYSGLKGAGKVYEQDGPDIEAEPGETLLKVNLWSRYYGVGYERGDILTICGVAEWCEANIPGRAVWYGGDSSGVLAEPFPAPKRDALRAHFYSERGRDYFHGVSAGVWGRNGAEGPPVSDCRLCPAGAAPQKFGGGGPGDWRLFDCSGCGRCFEHRNCQWTTHRDRGAYEAAASKARAAAIKGDEQ